MKGNRNEGGFKNMNRFPKKADDLEINTVEDGYAIYQRDRDRIHYLNHTAALVFEQCDGKTAVGEIPKMIKELFGLPEPPEKDVKECLDSMFKEHILV